LKESTALSTFAHFQTLQHKIFFTQYEILLEHKMVKTCDLNTIQYNLSPAPVETKKNILNRQSNKIAAKCLHFINMHKHPK